MDMRFMFYVRFCLLLLPNSPELGHTHTPRALLIFPYVPHLRAIRVSL